MKACRPLSSQRTSKALLGSPQALAASRHRTLQYLWGSRRICHRVMAHRTEMRITYRSRQRSLPSFSDELMIARRGTRGRLGMLCTILYPSLFRVVLFMVLLCTPIIPTHRALTRTLTPAANPNAPGTCHEYHVARWPPFLAKAQSEPNGVWQIGRLVPAPDAATPSWRHRFARTTQLLLKPRPRISLPSPRPTGLQLYDGLSLSHTSMPYTAY